GSDLYDQPWDPTELENALNSIFTDPDSEYPQPPSDGGDDGTEGDYEYNDEESWFSSYMIPIRALAGRRGDLWDRENNAYAGIGDEFALGLPRYFRENYLGGYDHVDYGSTEYVARSWIGFGASIIDGLGIVEAGGKGLLKLLFREAASEGAETLA